MVTTRLRAGVPALLGTLIAIGIGCADAGTLEPIKRRYTGPPPGEVSPVVLQTFDGSGEAVHPDPLAGASVSASLASAMPGVRWYLVATPYPGGNATYENPSFYAGMSFFDWRVPWGGHNPIVRPAKGYLSDPDQLYDPVAQEIRVYYRQVTSTNDVLLVRSSDGLTWSAPELVLRVPNHEAVSPTIVRKSENDWWMWTVNSGARGCGAASTTIELRRSVDGVTWSAPTATVLDGGNAGESPWHLDVEWIPERGEFWALYNAKVSGSCTTALLRLATSTDGVHWTVYPNPVLQRGVIPEFRDVVYRSAFVYDAATDRVTLWYSGARADEGRYTWRLAMQQMTRGALFAVASGTLDASVDAPVATDVSPRAIAPSTSPPLTNETAP